MKCKNCGNYIDDDLTVVISSDSTFLSDLCRNCAKDIVWNLIDDGEDINIYYEEI